MFGMDARKDPVATEFVAARGAVAGMTVKEKCRLIKEAVRSLRLEDEQAADSLVDELLHVTHF